MKDDRTIERWLLGEAGAEESAPLRDRARHDEALRGVYDDYFSVLRALESGEGLETGGAADPAQDADSEHVAASAEELRWLASDFFESWHEPSETLIERWRALARSWLTLPSLVGAAAVLAAVWLGVNRDGASDWESHDQIASAPTTGSRLVARGRGRNAELELELFCGNPPAPVNDAQCDLAQELTFAARATRSAGARTLTLFGIGAGGGEVKYYAPTPVELRGMQIDGEHWQTADFSIQLSVNHHEGPLHVFAVLAPRPARVAEIDAWAFAIANHLTLLDASESWIARLAKIAPSLVRDLCPDVEACEAVQTQLWLDSPGEQP